MKRLLEWLRTTHEAFLSNSSLWVTYSYHVVSGHVTRSHRRKKALIFFLFSTKPLALLDGCHWAQKSGRRYRLPRIFWARIKLLSPLKFVRVHTQPLGPLFIHDERGPTFDQVFEIDQVRLVLRRIWQGKEEGWGFPLFSLLLASLRFFSLVPVPVPRASPANTQRCLERKVLLRIINLTMGQLWKAARRRREWERGEQNRSTFIPRYERGSRRNWCWILWGGKIYDFPMSMFNRVLGQYSFTFQSDC